MAENQYGFPTEVLSLPSKGLLYPEDSPLRSGTIDVKYMTAKEEDILTSVNLINQGIVIDKLLESVIADSKIKLDDMLVGDKNAITVAARVTGYGSHYPAQVACPACSKVSEKKYDLNEAITSNIDEDELENNILASEYSDIFLAPPFGQYTRVFDISEFLVLAICSR